MAITSKTVRELKQLVQVGGEGGATAKNRSLPPAPARAGIGAVNSSAKQETDTRQAGGGIASPVLEGTQASPTTLTRTYHGLHVVTAVDGLFTFEYKSVASIGFVDANGSEVEFFFEDDPPV